MSTASRTAPDLTGRTAVVSGASRGIGLAIARKLHASGAAVIINYAHDAEAAEAALRLLPGAAAVRADIADPAGIDTVTAFARDRFGGLDVFVHNASYFRPGPTVGADPAAVRHALDVALNPLLYGAPALADLMSGRHGRIIAVSSSGARRAVPQYLAGGIAKAALESMVRYLAADLAGRGVSVNAVSTAKVDKGEGDNPRLKAIAARTPGGRLTTAEDVAGVVALLCADEAGWLQGQVVTADGGLGIVAG